MNLPVSTTSSQTMAVLLSSYPLTKGLSQEKLISVMDFFSLKTFTEQTTFILEDSLAREVFFIVSGGVRIYVTTEEGKEVTISLLGPGEILGEIAVLDEETRSASAQTIQDTQMIVIKGEDFRTLYKKFPEIAPNLVSTLAKRVRNTNRQLEDLVATTLSERTYKALSVLEKYFPEGEISLSHEELALILGATRPRVTEALKNLKDTGKIRLDRHKITFSTLFPREQTY